MPLSHLDPTPVDEPPGGVRIEALITRTFVRLALLTALLLAGCGIFDDGVGGERLPALAVDGQVVELGLEPALPHGGDEDTPGDHDPAWIGRRAAALLALRARSEAEPEVRLAQLTVHRPRDGAEPLRERRVWLVTFRGRPFQADGTDARRPSTALVLDAWGAELLAVFGVAP